MDQQRVGIEEVNRFLKSCENLGLSVEHAWLFGSYATNKMHEHSDIDVVLVSSQFSGNPFKDIDLYVKANIHYPDIEVHPYSLIQFQSGTAFLNEIKPTAIRLR